MTSTGRSDPVLVRRLDDLGIADRSVAGGKGASIGELTRAGIPVPPGFVATTAGFARVLDTLDADGRLRAQVGGLDPDAPDLEDTLADVRERIRSAPLPAGLQEAVTEHYAALGEAGADAPVAVRSSATGEDGVDASFAGLQDTYLWVRGAEQVVEHLRRCWASLYSLESVTYRLRRDIPEDGLQMAVVVQRMVDAHCSGVMFTCSPTTGDPSVVAIEASWGLGSAMVSGEVTPDSLTVSKVTGEVVRREVATKRLRHRMDPSGHGVVTEEVPEELRDRPCLDDEQLVVLMELARQVEQHHGSPQDIEWAIPSGGDGTEVLLLQSRPETVWANRSRASVTAPRDRAFDHVISLLGGTARSKRDGAPR